MNYSELIPGCRSTAEDVLTASVFGPLVDFFPRSLLFELLNLATDINGRSPEFPISVDIENATVHFWESIGNGIPDLTIRVGNRIIIVEVKYTSGKSGSANVGSNGKIENHQEDQLARYLAGATASDRNACLVYLTSDIAFPQEDIKVSIAVAKRLEVPMPAIFWISWTTIYEKLNVCIKSESDPSRKKIMEKLCEYLTLKGFDKFFHEWTAVVPINFCNFYKEVS